MIAVLIGVAIAVAWFVHRARRAAKLAGLNANKPQFAVEPPRRNLLSRKDHRL
jgi:hypothetical protein